MKKTKDGHKLVFNSYYWVVFTGKKASYDPYKPYEMKIRHDQSRKGMVIFLSEAKAREFCTQQRRKKK